MSDEKQDKPGLSWPDHDSGPTPPPEYVSRERDEERKTRKPLAVWDRIKLLILFGLLGVYGYQHEKAGYWGFAGFLLALTGTALIVGPDGRIAEWAYDLWSNPHSTRPGGAAALIAARHMSASFTPDLP